MRHLSVLEWLQTQLIGSVATIRPNAHHDTLT